jgi:hypothetical protein
MKKLYVAAIMLFSAIEIHAQAGGEDCASATVVGAIPFVGTGSTNAAADDYFASCADVGNQGGAKDVVYSYTTGSTAEYLTFSLCIAGTNYDSQLYIFEGSCASAPYACQEDGCTSPAFGSPYNSEIADLTLNASTTYYIVIDGYDAGSNGTYQLNITVGNAPATPHIPFTDMTSLLTTTSFHSGVAIGVSDMNNDGRDDIVRLYNNDTLFLNLQQAGGTFTESMFPTANPSADPWSMCIGDVDNDGYNEPLYCGWNTVELFKSTAATSFTVTGLNSTFIFSQGSNFMDIDVDGDLDIFVCNDVGTSMILLNDGTGAFTESPGTMDLNTVPASDNSGNYASMWTDCDDDGDIDLYITKCRQGVTDNTDPRRINQLFRNNGNGTWTEVGGAAGINSGWQGWVSDFGDIDNDGDLDLVIMNHDHETELFLNNGNGTFTDVTVGSGLEGSLGFAEMQCSFRDFDNDGWVDLLVAGGQHRLFYNNGDGTFTLDINAFPYATYWMESYAIGDLNNDGFLDIYGGYGSIYNTPSSRDDKLWMNDAASGNNYLKFDLQGVVSNRNAVGAKVKLYGPWGVQVREVRSGEGYGIHNSFIQHFGLGSNTTADSVYVYWPSGTVDLMRNIPANQTIILPEGTQNSVHELAAPAVKLYPNPASMGAALTVSGGAAIAEVRMYDATGRPVRKVMGQGAQRVLVETAGLAAGMYVAEVRFAGGAVGRVEVVVE